MSLALQAGFWGGVAGSALLIGAGLGYQLRISSRVVASIMAFGAGVLVAVLAFELVEEAHDRGGLLATSIGFVGGGVIFSIANWIIVRRGARHRKRSGEQQVSEQEAPGSGAAIAVGALLDGIPESIVIGLSFLSGGAVSVAMVVGVFLSNVPEGLSSAAGMRRAGRSARYVYGIWFLVAAASAIAAFMGNALLGGLPGPIVAAVTALAAGAILAMVADTMIPEAFEDVRALTGLVTVFGFVVAFWLSRST